MKKIKNHLFPYLILTLILLIGFLAFLNSRGYPDTQFKIVLLTAAFYISWGILHHLFEGDLHFKNVVEYLLIGGLAIIILKTLLFRS